MELNTITTTTSSTVTVMERSTIELTKYVSKEESTSNFMDVALNNADEETVSKYLSDFKNKAPVEIRFEGITYVVPQGFRGKKKVLHEICGKFPPSKLIAIMGPSGAGKSTLLDLISGYRTGGIKGKVIVNNNLRVLEEFRRISCYIQQDDRIQPLLTVEENMNIAADLMLGPNVPRERKNDMIKEIITILGLKETLNTRGARLSGGQKKRLSIALELINNPLVMFLDEPTTGLDSSSCKQCISLLRMLAHQGRTIICTIHQPSASLFQMFDQVYILAQGKCLYQGATDNLLRYLKSQKLPCPKYHNPADFIIEIASGEYGDDKIGMLVNGINNGKSLEWFRNSRMICDVEFKESAEQNKHVQKKLKNENKQMTPAYYQLYILLIRGFIKLKRDATLTHMRIIVNFLVSILLGLIYVNSGEDATKVIDNYNLIFSLIMHHVMSSMMLCIISFPMEMNIILKEHFNRWYSLKMYYWANMIVDIPVTAFSCLLFSSIVFFMTNQLFEWHRLGIYLLTNLFLVFIAQSIGYIFGTVFNVVNGTFAGPIFLVPMMMFSGFGVNLRDIPKYLEWGTHVSFFRYALEGLVESVYGFNRRHFSCYDVFCYYKDPQIFLQSIAMENINLWFSMFMLLGTLILTKIMGYYVLLWKVRSGR